MKITSRIFLFILLIFSAVISKNAVTAQCAMCKSTVESNQKEQVVLAKQKANGLNSGILYLMVLPYIMFTVIGYLWYKNSRKERNEKTKLDLALKKALS